MEETYKSTVSLNRLVQGVTFVKTQIAPLFSETYTYDFNDYVTYGGEIYKCISTVAVFGGWDASKWQKYDHVIEAEEDEVVVVDSGHAFVDFDRHKVAKKRGVLTAVENAQYDKDDPTNLILF